MENTEIIQNRKEFRDYISGKWESDEFIDSELNKKCKITFTINDKFGLTNDPIFVKANKTYSSNNSSETITIVFWWINVFLTSSYSDFKGGVVAKNTKKDEIGLYKTIYFSSFEFTDDNLILRFKKI
jgi:hypothetical protein